MLQDVDSGGYEVMSEQETSSNHYESIIPRLVSTNMHSRISCAANQSMFTHHVHSTLIDVDIKFFDPLSSIVAGQRKGNG